MTIEAKIIADSIGPAGIRLCTMQLRYPRFIHSEFMTHRVFSRNASSSRAIPVERMIEDLRRDPAMPVYWGSTKPGMQAGAELEPDILEQTKRAWLDQMEQSIETAEWMVIVGQLHKQIANRILEPWAHINVIVTATDWGNFFQLRCHPDAQPEMRVLAETMFETMEASEPIQLQPGEWHLPYVNANDWSAARHHQKTGRITRDEPMYDELAPLLIKVSAARCARVSYLTHDGRQTTIEEDMALYDRLVGSVPLHASPVEHQATPDEGIQHGMEITWMNQKEHGNFDGWRQYRKMLESKFI
jgi:thymidylate synthase ThyX